MYLPLSVQPSSASLSSLSTESVKSSLSGEGGRDFEHKVYYILQVLTGNRQHGSPADGLKVMTTLKLTIC